MGSLYGKRNLEDYIGNAFQNGKVRAVNIEEADKKFQSIGCQSPKEETNIIDFDNSIAFTTVSVKYPAQEQTTETVETDLPEEQTDALQPIPTTRKFINK